MAQLLQLKNGDLFVGLEARGEDAVGFRIPTQGTPHRDRIKVADASPADGVLPQVEKPKPAPAPAPKKTTTKKAEPKKAAEETK